MKKIGNVEIVAVLLQRHQTCLWREERGQIMTLARVRNEKGLEGHVVYCIEVDKRDILEEKLFTDNHALFADQRPEGHEIQDFSGLQAPGTGEEHEETLWETMEDGPVFDGCWSLST